MKTVLAKDIDEYLSTLPNDVREMLQKLRTTIKSVAPKAEEVISYAMPAFKYHGACWLYFSAFKNHCSLFPANSSLIAKMNEELKPYRTAKGTIQFTVEKPLPAALVKKIVKARMQENIERENAKKLMKATTKKAKKK